MKTVVNLFGPVNRLGMGVHFTNWAGHLAPKLGRVFVGTKGPVDLEPKRTAAENQILSCMDSKLFDPSSPSISLWHLSNVSDFGGAPRYLYTVFETTGFTNDELSNAEKVDGIIVPTRWAQETLLRYGVDSLVIPEGVNPDVFNYGDTGLQGFNGLAPLADDEVRFLSVGKLEKRKGMEVMLDAVLTLACGQGCRPIHILAQWNNPWEPLGHKAKFLMSRGFQTDETFGDMELWDHKEYPVRVSVLRGARPLMPRVELIDMMRACHWGLFPYFAEGWCLPLQESMAIGLPPICQAYSGPTEYLVPGCHINLDGQDAIAKDNLFFAGNRGTWRQVTTESLVAALQMAMNMPETERVKMGRLASSAALKFSWNHAVDVSIKVLSSLNIP